MVNSACQILSLARLTGLLSVNWLCLATLASLVGFPLFLSPTFLCCSRSTQTLHLCSWSWVGLCPDGIPGTEVHGDTTYSPSPPLQCLFALSTHYVPLFPRSSFGFASLKPLVFSFPSSLSWHLGFLSSRPKCCEVLSGLPSDGQLTWLPVTASSHVMPPCCSKVCRSFCSPPLEGPMASDICTLSPSPSPRLPMLPKAT